MAFASQSDNVVPS